MKRTCWQWEFQWIEFIKLGFAFSWERCADERDKVSEKNT